ncbi:hypothetical protein [Dethiothermospora halolimnae]|uniref:hypothetical protein n=1 Tax=Dethiothermospora halolimnae TaxID=3114390 RepID=UPI003CCBC89F
MDIEEVVLRELPLGEGFNYKTLYNDDRGAVHKEEYKGLLYSCLKEKVIEVKKYLVEEKVASMVFYDIADRSGKEEHQLKEKLKEYHQESYYNVAPFIYLLEKIEPNYKLSSKREEYKDPMLEYPDNIIIGHKFEGTNAFTRLFLKDSKIAINSFNDNIENLMDTLELDGISVYVLDVEKFGHREQDIVLYKLTKRKEFNKLKYEAQHKFLEEISKHKL